MLESYMVMGAEWPAQHIRLKTYTDFVLSYILELFIPAEFYFDGCNDFSAATETSVFLVSSWQLQFVCKK